MCKCKGSGRDSAQQHVQTFAHIICRCTGGQGQGAQQHVQEPAH